MPLFTLIHAANFQNEQHTSKLVEKIFEIFIFLLISSSSHPYEFHLPLMNIRNFAILLIALVHVAVVTGHDATVFTDWDSVATDAVESAGWLGGCAWASSSGGCSRLVSA